MKIDFYDIVDEERPLKYAVICSRFKEEWIFVRHKERVTGEVPGGHIEENELPDDAADRELKEESGALKFKVMPICDYSVQGLHDIGYGRLYFAEVEEIGPLPDFEMAEIMLSDRLPDKLTYAEIQPYLHKKILNDIL